MKTRLLEKAFLPRAYFGAGQVSGMTFIVHMDLVQLERKLRPPSVVQPMESRSNRGSRMW
jgi:hypothetical protein